MTSITPADLPPGRHARPAVPDVEALLRRQADDALAISGAQSSAWNGETGWLPRDGAREPLGVVGIADWDGTIYYDRGYVLRPLQTLFEHPGELDGRRLLAAKNALGVVLHENCHLLGADPADHVLTKERWNLPLVVLEEGATESFSQAHLATYVRRLGLDRTVPGLLATPTEATYPLFVPAVETLTRGVGRLTRQEGDEVLRRLVCEAGGRKYQTLGSLVLEGTGIADRIPDDDRAAAAAGLGEAAAAVLGEIADLGPILSREGSLRLSRRIGREALRSILEVLEDLDARYPKAPVPDVMARAPIRRRGMGAASRSRRHPTLDAAAARAALGLTR